MTAIPAYAIVKHLPAQRRGDLRGFSVITRVNGRRQENTVLAHTGAEALALVIGNSSCQPAKGAA